MPALLFLAIALRLICIDIFCFTLKRPLTMDNKCSAAERLMTYL